MTSPTQSERHPENLLELYFSNYSGLHLTKVALRNPKLPNPVISIVAESSKRGESLYAFKNSTAVVAATLILLRAQQLYLENSSDIPLISGTSEYLVEELATDIRINSEWIRKIFGLDELQIESAEEVFQIGQYDRIVSIILNPSFLIGNNVSAILNDSPLTCASEIDAVIRQLSEEQFKKYPERSKLKVIAMHGEMLTDEMKHASTGVVAPKILDIFSKKLEEQLIKNGVNAVKDKIDDLSKRELSYHLSQHTYIEMLPKDEWNISFEFEVINAGFLPISKRTHQYWFEHPQEEVKFDVKDEFGTPIKYTVTKASEKYREIRLELPKVLQALDRIKYKISYQVKGIIERDSFYYLSPRTLTKKLGLTVRRYDNRKFENARVSVECEGGFMKDNPPELIFKNENGIETIHWSHSSPRPGELYRTLWTNQESYRDERGVQLSKVIPFPDRPR